MPSASSLCPYVIVMALSLATTASAANPADTAGVAPAANAWSATASLSLKESFDDNIFLQDLGPSAGRDSWITTVIPAVGLAYKASPEFSAAFTFAPEINRFASAAEENFTLYRTGLTLTGKAKATTWEFTNSLIVINGADVAPTYLQAGGSPAAGGPGVRDRRDASIDRGQFRLTQNFGRWFIRPFATGYFHDFHSKQATTAGYQNFVDRNDLGISADLGWSATKDVWLVFGYRYGVQNQDQLFPAINATYYDNTNHRVLFGIEGKPWSCLKLNLSIGPEFRNYDGIVAAGFDRDDVYCYVDSSATITATKADTLTISAKSFQQPGFGGRSTYLDTTWDLTWRHKLTAKLTIGAGLRAYNTDFTKPSAVRDDWIYTGSGLIAYAFSKQCSIEVSYVHDRAETEVPNTPARAYTRENVSIGFKYVFR